MEEFYQGYRLKDDDLEISFWAYDVYYPGSYGNYYSPYWIRYGLGYINENDHYHEIGPRYRIPEELKTGYFRPNFIIGEKWPLGTYEIRWKYKDFENSSIEFRKVQFKIVSAGIYNQTGYFPDYLDLPASLSILV